jgi:hypothetical protein
MSDHLPSDPDGFAYQLVIWLSLALATWLGATDSPSTRGLRDWLRRTGVLIACLVLAPLALLVLAMLAVVCLFGPCESVRWRVGL